MKNLLLFIVLFFSVNGIAQQGYTETVFPSNPSLPSLFSSADFDDSGNVWMGFGRKFPVAAIGLGGGALAKWDGTKNQVFSTSNSPLASNAVISVACAKGAVWIGTSAGLQQLKYTANVPVWKTYDSLDDKGLGNKIICLKPAGNNLWIGSDDGFGVLDMNTGSFTHFDGSLWGKAQPAAVYDIVEGDNGEIWAATNQGLVQKSGTSFTLFDKTTSALKTDNLYALHWKKSTSELWIGGDSAQAGFAVFYGLYRLKNNVITDLININPCYAKSRALPIKVYSITEEKQSGDILVTSFTDYPFSKPSFLRINDKKVISYYIQGSAQTYISSGFITPVILKYNRDDKLWLGVANNRMITIDDIGLLPNNDDNIEKIMSEPVKNLDINQVKALISGRGDMFWDLSGESRYEVPKNSCKSAIFASALWMGGTDPGNNLHVAAMTYRQNGADYFPGPLDTATAKGDSAAIGYRKIWNIHRWEIEEFKKKYADGSLAGGSYTPPADFLSWPAHGTGNHAHNLAPFVDIDGNGKYEPMKGDYPAIKGEQALYWIFNDNAGMGIHSETSGLPLGAEVHAMAYAYNCDSIMPGSPNEALNYTTFYEYKIINRSTDNYSNTYFGVWTDVDLGNSFDDKIGCNPQGNYAFVYNGDNNDEGALGYGTNPPMLSVVFLSDSMTNFMYYENDFSVMGNPTLAEHYYNQMRSVWKDGLPLTYGGNGYQTGAPVKHMYSGTPYSGTGWLDSAAGDKRFLQSAGPFNFEPGGVKTFSYAIVYSHQPNQPNGLNTSWAKNTQDVNAIKNWYASQNFPTCLTKTPGVGIPEPAIQNGEIKVVPNPFSGNTALAFSLNNDEEIAVEVYNMLGQVVYSHEKSRFAAGANTIEIELANQPAGIYMYVLKSGNAVYSGRMANVSR